MLITCTCSVSHSLQSPTHPNVFVDKLEQLSTKISLPEMKSFEKKPKQNSSSHGAFRELVGSKL